MSTGEITEPGQTHGYHCGPSSDMKAGYLKYKIDALCSSHPYIEKGVALLNASQTTLILLLA